MDFEFDLGIIALVKTCLLCIIPVTILCSVFRSVKTSATKIIESAKEAGRSTTATLMKSRYYRYGYEHPNWPNRAGWYQYTVDGHVYEFKRKFKTEPPEELTVYWRAGRPSKPYVGMYDKLGAQFLLYMAIPLFVFIVVFIFVNK